MSISRRDFVAALAATGTIMAVSKPADAHEGCVVHGDAFPVYVIATVTAKPGKRDELIRLLKTIVPDVHAEDGYLYYEPAVDVETGLPAQDPLRPDVMVVVEKWASLEALRVHLDAPHMGPYREAVKDIVEGVTLQVLRPA